VSARSEVLARIRAANDAASGGGAARPMPIPREYRTRGEHVAGSDAVVELFAARVGDYRAGVHGVDDDGVPALLAQLLAHDNRVVAPHGLPARWTDALATDGRDIVIDGRPAPLTARELDAVDAAVTACRVAIAETGTVVLDADADQGRRALSLVPDHHVVVVRADQIVQTVPEAIGSLTADRPITFISGPSATSDIEFSRVEGVHGPRRLDVVIVSSAPQ
jgi:L-lactate dehydrogenase complex protein LldG